MCFLSDRESTGVTDIGLKSLGSDGFLTLGTAVIIAVLTYLLTYLRSSAVSVSFRR